MPQVTHKLAESIEKNPYRKRVEVIQKTKMGTIGKGNAQQVKRSGLS